MALWYILMTKYCLVLKRNELSNHAKTQGKLQSILLSERKSESVHRSVVPDSLLPRGLWPLSMGFSRKKYWSGMPFPSPGDLPNPGMEPRSLALWADSLPSEPWGKPWEKTIYIGFQLYDTLEKVKWGNKKLSVFQDWGIIRSTRRVLEQGNATWHGNDGSVSLHICPNRRMCNTKS